MINTGMVLCPIIPKISMYRPPKLAELPLAIPASEPVKFHVNRFVDFGNNFIIDEAVCYFFVSLHGRFVFADGLALRVSCSLGLLFWHSKNSSRSAYDAYGITLRMIVDRLRTAPLFGGFSSSLDRKWWPPE